MAPRGCICDFYETCNNLGVLHCKGCGGDLCVCTCGGEIDCYGCEDCEDERDGGDDGDDWTEEAP